MAAIVHRCACAHLDHFHVTGEDKDGRRPCYICSCRDSDPAPPEIIPTWRAASLTAQAMPDPVLVEPGTVDGPGLGRLCDCDDCWTLYETTVGQAA
ncbi:hypothetical protein [Amycolatopsis sp. NPDC004625]|uniref:hypothetical protein n=1 Tax=Amycolatopsis sp. NPDC004625 TaxID=3154670 RepID=UPI0033BC3F3B